MKHLQIVFFILLSGTLFSQSYLGTITKQVNFRMGPGSEYEIINSLKIGTQIFISSLETENDFYNIIDIKTDNEGYVHKSFVKIGKLVSESDGGFIAASGESSGHESEVNIYNNTNITLTLKLNSDIYKFAPKEKKNIVLEPGDYSFRASAPGVIPNIGIKNFKINQAYKWEFYIVTKKNN